jgi:hypothetical protein
MALTTTQIQQAYVTFFSRPADPVGLAYWQAYKGSVADLYATFAQQTEYSAAFAGLSSAQKVNVVYQNLFGRTPESSGLMYWADKVETGAITVANLALAVSAGAQLADKVTVESRVAAAAAFTTALDTPAEILGYSGATANASAKEWLSGVTTAANLATAVAAVSTATAGVVAVGGQSGSTFTLTTDSDEFAGTVNGDNFSASTVDKLSTDDMLDGGAGNDTLTVRVDAALTASPDIANIETIKFTRVAADVDMTGTDLSDVSTIVVDDVRADAAVSADTMPDTISITNSFSGGTTGVAVEFTFDDPTNESLELAVSGAGVLNKDGEHYNITTIAVDNGGDITALSLNVSGINYITLDDAGSLDAVETVTVKGTGDLYVVENASDLTAITSIDASALVGGLQFTGDDPALGANDFSDLDNSTTLEVVKGGSGANRISVGIVTTDTVYTMQGGNDVIDAGAATGDDTYNTGAGNDTVTASSGDITADLGAGNDTIRMANGEMDDNDSIKGGEGVDTLRMDYTDADTASSLITDEVITGFETIRFDAAANAGAAVTLDAADFDGISTFQFGAGGVIAGGDVTFDSTDGKVINITTDFDANELVITSTDRSDTVTVNVTGSAVPSVDGNADADLAITDVDTVTLTVTANANYTPANLVGNQRYDQVATADLNGVIDGSDTVTVTMAANAKASTATNGAQATATLDGLTVTAVSTLNITGTATGAADNNATLALTVAATTVDTVNVTLNATGATGDNVVSADLDLTLDTVGELTVTVNDGFGGTDAVTGASIVVDAANTTNNEMVMAFNVKGIVENLELDATSAESVDLTVNLDNLLVAGAITVEDTTTFSVAGKGTIGELTLTVLDSDTSADTAVIDLSDFAGSFSADTANGGVIIDSAVATSILVGAAQLESSWDEAYELDLTDGAEIDTVAFQSDMKGSFEINGFDDAADLLDLSAFNTSFNDILETAYDEDGDLTNDGVILTSKSGKFDFEIVLVGVVAADITAADYSF